MSSWVAASAKFARPESAHGWVRYTKVSHNVPRAYLTSPRRAFFFLPRVSHSHLVNVGGANERTQAGRRVSEEFCGHMAGTRSLHQ